MLLVALFAFLQIFDPNLFLFLLLHIYFIPPAFTYYLHFSTGRPGSSEVPRNPLTRWDVSSMPANGIFLTKKIKNKNKNAQRVEDD